MKYVNQLEHPHMLYVTRCELDEKNREYGRTTTIKSSGCGLCAAIMVADRLLPSYDFDLYDAIQLSYDAKANLDIGTDYELFAPVFAENLGLRYKMTDSLKALRHCLRTGGAAVVLVGGKREGHVGLFTHSGHYMTVIGEEPDGRLAILDPSLSPTKYEEEGRKGRVEIKNDVIVLCDAQILHEETEGKTGPYYLFWRA